MERATRFLEHFERGDPAGKINEKARGILERLRAAGDLSPALAKEISELNTAKGFKTIGEEELYKDLCKLCLITDISPGAEKESFLRTPSPP